ncbi:hypothetical protein M407DRAFT_241425 [Tulasnella calospora MUT 4182]|uniref:Uncharacterized protein n=1 Tax=Tulasnella calospora MUT 4182 TaxID=1051891 RepID=A0A0C3MFP8_9AGAM|nr:hypothetical protein M407DRAFT_241425 [Tulasnella calospora MUT 4182]
MGFGEVNVGGRRCCRRSESPEAVGLGAGASSSSVSFASLVSWPGLVVFGQSATRRGGRRRGGREGGGN